MDVFWRNGYEGASMSDLTKATGVNKPSLYAAFGDKASLFRLVLDRYAVGPARYVARALAEPTARAVVKRLLQGAVNTTTNPATPPGCLLLQGGLACGDENQEARDELVLRRRAAETALRERLKRAKAQGELPADAKPADLARYVVAVIRGISVQAASGASRKELRRVAKIAMRAWP